MNSESIFTSAWAPLSSGDLPYRTLLQSMRSSVQALSAGCGQWDLFLSSPLPDVLPILQGNPLIRHIHAVEDSAAFPAGVPIHGGSDDESTAWAEIQEFYRKTGKLPGLRSPKGCSQEAEEFRRQIGNHKFLVALDLQGEDDLPVWMEFLALAGQQSPHIAFVLLGLRRGQRLPDLNLPHIFVPRLMGFNPGHELALVLAADLFLGTPAGHAPLAMFSDGPYALFGVTPNVLRRWNLPADAKGMPFRKEHQAWVPDALSVPLLQKYLEQMQRDTATRAFARAQERFPQSYPVTVLLNSVENHTAERVAAIYDSMLEAKELSEKGAHEAAHRLLDRMLELFPGEAETVCDFHLCRAILWIAQNKTAEALKALDEEQLYHPENTSVDAWRARILGNSPIRG